MTNTNWTIKNMPDQTGKIIIITGANAGLGFEATKQLAQKGATVVMACRSQQRANKAVAEIKKIQPDALVEFMELDLASLESVKSFAKQFQAKHQKLDVLLNNAGIMFGPHVLTKDGFESTFGIDHLGHFALTGLLMEVLKNTQNSRVVNVSSFAHQNAEINFDDVMLEKGYDAGKAYPQAKLANILFTNELQRQFEKAKVQSKAISVNPGFVKTGWIRHMRQRNKFQAFFINIMLQVLGQSVEMGTLGLLRATTDTSLEGGEYLSTKGRFGGYPVPAKSSEISYNKNVAKKLWEMSEELTGVKYSFKD